MAELGARRAQHPRPPAGADRIFSTREAVIVLDGASSFLPTATPAGVYTDRLGEALAERLSSEPLADLRDVLAAAITVTAQQLHLDDDDSSPSAALAIARRRDESLDVLVLGDVLVATPAEVMIDERMAGIGADIRRRYRRRLSEGSGFDQEHHRLLRELQHEQRRHRNRPGGYWIASSSPAAAAHAITRSTPLPPWAILATDGSHKPLSHRALDTWAGIANLSANELDKLLLDQSEWESVSDPRGSECPRAKRSDDKAIAVLGLR